jgi:hypothetical protein
MTKKDNINFETIEYEFRKYASIAYMADEMFENIDEPIIKWLADNSFGELGATIFRLTWELACRDLLEWKYPEDWKEAFKERWFPEWAKKKWPVVYSSFTLTEIAGIKRSTIPNCPKRYTIQRKYG